MTAQFSEPMPAPDSIDRWEISGGTCRVTLVGETAALVDLCRCDGGEVVETLRLTDPGARAWAAMRLAEQRVGDAE